ncbi:MAG TPA: porin family protein [Bacteroidales bacterium]|nr:porin family protein [Bacteroidales bacterium]
MKTKVLLLTLVTLLITHTAFSQVKPFRFGLKVAPAISWVSPDSEGYKNKGAQAGFSWGFISDITITENYFFATGFNVNYLKGKISYPFQDLTVSSPDIGTMVSDMKLRYIDVPLTLKMKTNRFDKMQYYGQIGFSLAFNIKTKTEETFKLGNVTIEKNERDRTDDMQLLKASLVIGGGIEYYIDNSTSILVGVTYYNGISNIMKGYNTVDGSVKQKAAPHFIELNLGVIF